MNEMLSRARRVLIGTAAAAFAIAAVGGTGASIVSAHSSSPAHATVSASHVWGD